MKDFNVEIREFRGSSYTIGYEQGKLIDRKQLSALEHITKENMNVQDAKAVFKSFAPHLLDEIQGLADGIQISFEQAMRFFSGYDLPKLEAMGCSSVVTKNYMVRNYDFSPLVYDHQLVFSQSEEASASVGYSLHYVGRHEGVNEHGVSTALHFVNNEDQVTGLMCSTIIRMLADNCKSTDGCIHVLKEIPHACSYNYSIGDRNGKHVVVEASPDKVEVREGEEALSCTNHFQEKTMQTYNRKRLGSSERRLRAMTERSGSGLELFNWFSDPSSEMFYQDYEQFFGTLHTFGYFFQEDRFITKVANGKETLDLHFKDWVNGQPLSLNRLTGSLTT